MFSKLLIANRGEIAVRIARTARRIGISTVAVYSDADESAMHSRCCDEAIHIGASPSSESYLKIDRILEAMRSTGATAVHPGYGFLSENADFAEAVESEGWIFVGPTPDTIRQMGSKSSAKDLMEEAGVPTTPGYQGDEQTLRKFELEAERIGYPILLKASAGGGGKGMRLVESKDDIEEALASAKRESRSAFGDEKILIEKFVKPARHVEVQIFGDGKGDVVHLYDRDCSIQRRHQKIIEEAPAFGLDSVLREQLLQAGVNAGKAVNYRGAGTVEFLYDIGANSVYFMEMNTRLQVEHPVTEMITGVDLVEWQLRLASGEGLPRDQTEIQCSGHSLEARVYAEDPYKDFVPSTGILESLKLPTRVRNDCGVEVGQEISAYYDPMIAKIVVQKQTREQAIIALKNALSETRISGLETNLEFLGKVLGGESFIKGEVSTSYIEDHRETLFACSTPSHIALASIILYRIDQTSLETNDPWDCLKGFRLNDSSAVISWLKFNGETLMANISADGRNYSVKFMAHADSEARRKGERMECVDEFKFSKISCQGNEYLIKIDNEQNTGAVITHREGVKVFEGGRNWDVTFADVFTCSDSSQSIEGSLTSPMSGVVTSLVAEIGALKAGDVLMTIEAMKMEHKIIAPSDGVLLGYRFAVGQQLKDGDLLVDFE